MANRPRKHRPRPFMPPKPCELPNICKDYQADMFKPGECAFCFNGYCLIDKKRTK
jgi:hypothetical protein